MAASSVGRLISWVKPIRV